MVVIIILAALASSIPSANINEICRTARVDALPEDRANAMRGCVGDETSARDQLRKEWGRFSAADRGNCVETPGMKFSYVELLTCLEMQRGGTFGKGSIAGSPATTMPVAIPTTTPDEAGQKP